MEFTPSLRFRGISLACAHWKLSGERLLCKNSTLVVRETPLGKILLRAAIEWRPISDRLIVTAAGTVDSETQITVHFERSEGGTQVLVEIDKFDVARASKLISPAIEMLGEHVIGSGAASLSANCSVTPDDLPSCVVEGSVAGLNVNGVNVAENVAADFNADYSRTLVGDTISFGVSLHDGAMYVEPGFALGSINPGFFY